MTIQEEVAAQTEEWRKTQLLYNSALKEISTKIEILNNEFVHSHRYNPIEHVTQRIKTPDSIARKLKRIGYEPTLENMEKYLCDIAGIRIICSFTSDIYRIAGMIARQDDVAVLKIKDYMKHPKENGYKSFHMVVTVPIYLSTGTETTKVEIQIRTIAMDFWASLEHKLRYKKNIPAEQLDELSRELYSCAENIASIDERMNGIHIQMERTLAEQEAENKKKKWPLLPGLS